VLKIGQDVFKESYRRRIARVEKERCTTDERQQRREDVIKKKAHSSPKGEID